MRVFILLFIISISIASPHAQIEVTSFYFEESSAIPTGYTNHKMKQFEELMKSHFVQVIEINSYADLVGSAEINKALAFKRQEFVLNYLKLEFEEIELNNYGKGKTPVNFNPFNWHRVDVRYHLGAKREARKFIITYDTIPAVFIPRDSIPKGTTTSDVKPVTENIPIVLPLEFVGGTLNLVAGSEGALKDLLKSLNEHPELNAHLRGHVCCTNKKLKSKQRAKVIYTYLIENKISKKRLSYEGFGNEVPLVFPEKTVKDRELNRRVEIVFFKPEQKLNK